VSRRRSSLSTGSSGLHSCWSTGFGCTSPNKRYFVSHNIIDLLFVLVPFLRPLHVARSARAIALLRATRGTIILLRAVDAVQDVIKRHKLGYTLLVAFVLVVGSGLLVAAIEESDPERNIRSIHDGLWWAVTTVTTVGHGDRFPITPIGRAIGAGVMIIGIDCSDSSPPRWLRSWWRRTLRRRSTLRLQRFASDSGVWSDS
jgi:Ion channel